MRTKSGGVFLAALLALGSGCEPQSKKDALNFSGELVSYAELAGSSDGSAPSCKGRKLVAIVEKQAKIDELYFELPDKLRAKTPQEVTAVVWVRRISKLYGHREGLMTPVNQETAWMVVVDRATGARIHESTPFAGAEADGTKPKGGAETFLPSTPAMLADLEKACG